MQLPVHRAARGRGAGQAPAGCRYDLGSVHTTLSGAAPLDGELGSRLAERLGCRVLQGYGMTEMSPVSHLIPRDSRDAPVSSVGYTVPNISAAWWTRPRGRTSRFPRKEPARPGHLLCRGPNVMLGYLNRPQETADTLDAEGFLHTGDIATVRADGVVTIVDRLKELIKYKGYQIAPAELEALLLTHPGIADSAVIGSSTPTARKCPRRSSCASPARTATPWTRRVSWPSWRPRWRRSRRSAAWSSSRPCRSRPQERSCAGCSKTGSKPAAEPGSAGAAPGKQ